MEKLFRGLKNLGIVGAVVIAFVTMPGLGIPMMIALVAIGLGSVLLIFYDIKEAFFNGEKKEEKEEVKKGTVDTSQSQATEVQPIPDQTQPIPNQTQPGVDELQNVQG